MARLLVQYCIDHELPFVGFDADKSHGARVRFYGRLHLALGDRPVRESRPHRRNGGRLDIVLVLNPLRGAADFGILEQSGQKQRALELGARIMPLKRLHETAMIKIDAARQRP